MRKQWLVFIVVLLTSITLWGCGSSRSSSDSNTPTPPIADAERTGNCTICHTVDVHSSISGIAGVNLNASGLGSAITHDCEDCHGGGQYHHGTGPIPYPSPDGARCVTCHTTQTGKILASRHNAGNADNTAMLNEAGEHYLDNYCQRCHTAEGSVAFKATTGDKTTITTGITAGLDNADADGNPTLHNPVCGACHNALTKELVQVDASWDPNQNAASDQFDLCTSCHNYKLNDGTIFGSGTETVNGGTTAEFYHNNAWYRQIPTTHYDDPSTLSGQGTENGTTIINQVEGYVIREDSANPCFDCHGHELLTNTSSADDPTTLTIQTAWAKSAHGGKILTQVMDAVDLVDCTGSTSLSHGRCNEQVTAALGAYTSDSVTPAWTHYNWDDNATRSACQMCHTATGAANFMMDPANYNPANNDYSHLVNWSATGGSPQNEVIYCWTCHTSAESGALRTPGAITLAYTNVAGNNPTLPDYGDSNVCVNCHGGRGGMDSLLNTATTNPPDPAGAAVTGGTRTHYYASAATINQALTDIGYRYYADSGSGLASLDYSDKPYFAHNGLGCAECHMTASTPTDQASHTFDVVEKTAGVITAIASEKCVECHDGEHALFVAESLVGTTQNIWNGTAAVPTTVTAQMATDAATELELEAEGYNNAIDALGAVLTTAGTPPQAGYPYFSGSATDQGHGGAMHNWSYLHHEPGGFAHNRYYVKRLLFDSIDWLTDPDGNADAAGSRALDGQITLDATTYAEAIHWLGGDATTGVIATRP